MCVTRFRRADTLRVAPSCGIELRARAVDNVACARARWRIIAFKVTTAGRNFNAYPAESP